MGFTHDNKDNKSVDWYTPPHIFEDLGLEFDLDPCQPETKIPWIPAKKHYWEAVDGLSQPWDGLVWLNPPYGKHTPLWLDKMAEHGEGVALVFARTDTIWFQKVSKTASALLFLKGRISFVDGLGVTAGGGAGAGSMLIAWGETAKEALRNMSHKGLFVELK
jgi:DNA N-6-adenine-methyltransferase (Dam)